MSWGRPTPAATPEAFAEAAAAEFDRRFGVPLPAQLGLALWMARACGRTASTFVDQTGRYWRLAELPVGLASENAAKLAPLRSRPD